MSFLRLIIISISVVAIRCTPIYAPNVRNAPIFEKAFEFQNKIYYDPLKVSAGTVIDIQSGLSITNHLAAIGNISQSKDSYTKGNQVYQFYRHYWESGVGYYQNFTKRINVSFYAGYGRGLIETQDVFVSLQNNSQPLDLRYDRYFIQGVYAVKRKLFTFSPSFRISNVIFKRYKELGIEHLFHETGNFFIEPCFTFLLNARESKNLILSHSYAIIQLGLNLKIGPVSGETRFKDEYGYAPLTSSFGIGFRIGPVHNSTNQ